MPLDVPAQHAAIPPAEARAALARVLVSVPFAHSPQLRRFLEFVVQETLAGRGERLKEYVIALEVFERPATFDPRIDSLVRVEARRVRQALAGYYAGQGQNDQVVIELPKGSYVPELRCSARPASDREGTAASGRRAAARSVTGWRRIPTAILGVGLAAVAAAALGVAARFWERAPAIPAGRGGVVVAGFANSTGEAVFDEALAQGLMSELERSPVLDVIPERRVTQVLQLMGRATSDRLDRESVKDLCSRAGGRAAVTGSIDRIGSQYVIGLLLVDCETGEDFAHLQHVASGRDSVLRALAAAARVARGRLGESLASIERSSIPVEEVTTRSLEALKAYGLGKRIAREQGSPADAVYYQRALEIDPAFPAAHAALGVSLINSGEAAKGAEHLREAHRLRDRVSERERHRISASYHQIVTGELDKAIRDYELWIQASPSEPAPHINLGLAHLWRGDYEKAVAETREALRLDPGSVLPHTNLAALLIKLGRPREAEDVLRAASSRRLVSKFLHLNLCYLAFLRGDHTVVERQLSEVRDSPGDRAALLALQSDTAAYRGRLREARSLSEQATALVSRAGGGGAAATWLLTAALREAECGDTAMSRRLVREALALSTGRDASTLAALALARAGDAAGAQALKDRLEADHPLDSILSAYWAPTIEAATELAKHRPDKARRLLDAAAPFELGSPPPIGLATLYPVYLRGEACLRMGLATQASAEFQKILAHPGLVLNWPLASLARLQLARAHLKAGKQAEARKAFDEFLALWQDADPGNAVLQRARAERRSIR